MWCALLSFVCLVGCQNYRDQLSRGQGYYEQNQYEAALAVWRNLESDRSSLSRPEVVRYCYLRGMTDYRLGYERDARYWLGLAQAALNRAQAHQGEAVALQPDEVERLGETLTKLNNEVYGIELEQEEDAGSACEWTSDCDSGFTCQQGTCVQAEGAAPSATTDQTESAPAAEPPPVEASPAAAPEPAPTAPSSAQ